MSAAAHGAVGAKRWVWASSTAEDPRAPPPASASDERLAAAAAKGSADAFGHLLARRQQALRAFLRRLCSDWSLADDLAQETFLAAWSRRGALARVSNVPAWLCGIGYHKYLTAMRGARRARRREVLWSEAAPRSAPVAIDSRLALEAAMAELPVDQRACVALCLAADFSHTEAAEALHLPLGTVKSHVARGRARLLSALEIVDD